MVVFTLLLEMTGDGIPTLLGLLVLTTWFSGTNSSAIPRAKVGN